MRHKAIVSFVRLSVAALIIGLNLEAVGITSAKSAERQIEKNTAAFNQPAVNNLIASAGSQEDPLTILKTDQGLVIELNTPAHTIETLEIDGQVCQVFRLPGFTDSAEPGWPQLPYKGTLITLSELTEPILTILDEETETLDGSYEICPVSQPIVDITMEGEISYSGEELIRDPEAYNMGSFYPSASVELGDRNSIRGELVTQIQFHPYQYNPTSKQVRVSKRIRVQIEFGEFAVKGTSELLLSEDEIFDHAFQNVLPGSKLSSESASMYPLVTENVVSSPASNQQIKMWVEAKGIYALSFETLTAAGAEFGGIDPQTFRIFNQGNEIAIEVSGSADNSFDPGDQVIFYGEAVDTRYTAGNVYWLSWGESIGKRILNLNVATKSGKSSSHFLSTKRIEVNKTYQSSMYDTSGDHWFWDFVSATSAPVSWSYTFQVNGTDIATNQNAVLRGSFKSQYATPQHHTKVYINEHFIGEGFYNTGTQFNFSFPFPNGYLLQGDNTLRVEIPLDNGITRDSIYLNWFELDYWRFYQAQQDQLMFSGEMSGTYGYLIDGFISDQINLFDITNPTEPARLSGFSVSPSDVGYSLNYSTSTDNQHKYYALASSQTLTPTQMAIESPSDLKSTANSADYLLITHGDFLTEMQQLADWRRNQGLRVALIDVQDIYDEFNYGVMDPRAIRDFIAFAYQSWQPPSPQYVFLVGDGHLDPRNYRGTNERIFIPAYLLPVDNYISETASDNRYVTVSGTDNFPDLMIGRLPIKTSIEAGRYISKLISYEQKPFTVEWNDDVLFVSDNPDIAGNFISYSEQLANYYLPEGYSPRKVYLGNTHTTAGLARTAILENINQGNLIVNYVGHGYQSSWAAENLLANSSVNSMMNVDKPALFTMMSCLTGYFHQPSPATSDLSSLAEVLTRADNKGAIVSWASSGMGLAAGQALLNEGIYQAIFYSGKYRIGEAALQAKLYLINNSQSHRDLIDLFTLFGDPATKLNVRPSDLTVQLSVSPKGGVESGMPITYTLTYRNVGLAEASQVRINHPLPEKLVDPVVHFSEPSGYLVEDSRLSWELPKLLPGQMGTIQVTGRVATNDPEILISQANIESPIFDADESNNFSDPVSIQVNHPTAGTFVSAQAALQDGHVVLIWETSQELDVFGFNIWRSTTPGSDGDQTLLLMIPSQNIGSVNGAKYSYVDSDIQSGQTYYYEIEMLETGASSRFELNPVFAGSKTFFPIISH